MAYIKLECAEIRCQDVSSQNKIHKTQPGIKDPLIKLAPTLKKRVVKHTGADICILTAGLDSRMVRLTLRLQ